MKQILIGLTASAALLSAIGSASACDRADNSSQSSVSSGAFIQLAQVSGGSGNGSSSGGKPVDQQFIDPNVRSAPGETPVPSGSAGDTDVTGSTTTTPDASQSKRKNTEEPTNQSGSK